MALAWRNRGRCFRRIPGTTLPSLRVRCEIPSHVARALAWGCGIVLLLYCLANVAYLVVLTLPEIQNAPSDRVAAAVLQKIFPGMGPLLWRS